MQNGELFWARAVLRRSCWNRLVDYFASVPLISLTTERAVLIRTVWITTRILIRTSRDLETVHVAGANSKLLAVLHAADARRARTERR